MENLLRAGRKAEPSSLRRGEEDYGICRKARGFPHRAERQSRAQHLRELLIWNSLVSSIRLRVDVSTSQSGCQFRSWAVNARPYDAAEAARSLPEGSTLSGRG